MNNREGDNDNGGQSAPKGKTPFYKSIFLPGKTIGILGSGQLGRMSAMAAKSLGYRVAVYDAVENGPACSCADIAITAPFDDWTALGRFAEAVDLVTVEFENIPIKTLEFLESRVPLHPSASVIRVCQDRVLEKQFLLGNDFPVAPFRVITSAEELHDGLTDLGCATILKTAALGYDGKGQLRLAPGDNANVAWQQLAAPRAVLEKKIAFASEASVICARSISGESCCFPVQENIHRNGILDITIAPARLDDTVSQRAQEIALGIAAKLGVVGLITVEFFVLSDGELVVNELAPRPHNSGHHTLETAITSQFAQHVRAACGLPLGATQLRSPGVMLNLLGDLWNQGEPDWALLLRETGLFLHLYGKSEAKNGRKMGHFTVLGSDDIVIGKAISLRVAMSHIDR